MHLKNEGGIESEIQERMDYSSNEENESISSGESETHPLSFLVHRAVFCGMNAKLLGMKLLHPKWRCVCVCVIITILEHNIFVLLLLITCIIFVFVLGRP